MAFIANGNELHVDNQSPFGFEWTNVAASQYAIAAIATDNVGGTTTSEAVNITVTDPANELPTVLVSAPISGQIFKAGNPITITAQANDADGSITQVNFLANAGLIGTDNTANGNEFSTVWENAPPGSHTIQVVAADNDGANGTSASLSVTVEGTVNQPPSVILTRPIGGTSFVRNNLFTVTVAASDPDNLAAENAGIASVILRVNGTQTDPTPLTDTPYEFELRLSATGAYTMEAVATDTSGATSVSLPVRINIVASQPPTVNITQPIGQALFNQGQPVAITATATAAEGTITSVEFLDNGTLLFTDIGFPYTFSTTTLPVGSHTLTARATDSQGVTTTSAPVQITVRVPPVNLPEVAITQPIGGSRFDVGQNITIVAERNDEDIIVNQLAIFVSGTLMLTGTVNENPLILNTTQIPAGNHEIIAVLTYNDDFSVESKPVNIIVGSGNTAPLVAIVAPPNNAPFINQGDDVTLTATANDSDGTVTQVEFFANSGSVNLPLGVDVNDGDNSFSIVWANIPAGTHTITAVATDNRGGPNNIFSNCSSGQQPTTLPSNSLKKRCSCGVCT